MLSLLCRRMFVILGLLSFVEEHLSLHGISKSSRKGKSILKKYDDQENLSEAPLSPPLEKEAEKEKAPTEGKQFTLDSF